MALWATPGDLLDHLGVEQAVVAGTGHLPNMERPGEFDRVVLEFLARLDRAP